jgi:hypothetical protein
MPAAWPSSNSARRRKSRRTARRNATVKRDRNFDRGRWTIGLTPTQWTRDWELRGIGSHRELVLKTSDHGAPQRDSFAKNTATFFAKACSWRSVATSRRSHRFSCSRVSPGSAEPCSSLLSRRPCRQRYGDGLNMYDLDRSGCGALPRGHAVAERRDLGRVVASRPAGGGHRSARGGGVILYISRVWDIEASARH